MADVDLLFEASSAASTPDLVFGADTTLRTVFFAATIPAPSGGFEFEVEVPAVAVTFAATMAPPTGAFVLELDEMPATYLGPYAGAPWASGTPLKAAPATRWRHGAPLEAASAPRWRDGARVGAGKGIPWQHGTLVRPGSTDIPWQHGTLVRPGSTGVPWRHGAQVRPESTDLPWRDGVLALVRVDSGWRDGRAVALPQRMPWRDGRAVALPQRLRWRDGAIVIDRHRLPWQHGLLVETHGNTPFPPVIPPEPDPCYEASTDLVFSGIAALDGNLVFRCDYATPDGPTATVVVPIRRAYIVINTVSLTILDGPALTPLAMSMAIDADSWTWRWSAALPAAELALVDTGAPVEVVASVNGTAYRLVIEQIGRERSFGRGEVRVSGRGRNAVLDVLTGTFANPALRTAAQLMDDALAVGGDGWSIDFGLDDWLVPAGVWSAQGTAMAALRTIAAAAGGYLQPHRTNAVVRVLPRYAVAPWDWGGVVPDIELPTAPVVREGIEWVAKPAYNRVFVSGTRDGVLAQVTRTGSAGDVVAPMVTDALITAAAAGRQRGLAILGDTGRQQLVTLALPVLPETGVIEPGKFVRYVDGATERVGVVRSTSIDARFPSLTQTIGVETHA